MPYIKLVTNKTLSNDKKQQLMKDMTALVSRDLSKPEKVVMVSCHDQESMFFGGSGEPAVLLELRSIRLPEENTSELTKSLTSFVMNNLEIPADRTFLNFFNFPPHMWGYNGSTF